jgi:hypothetical protein
VDLPKFIVLSAARYPFHQESWASQLINANAENVQGEPFGSIKKPISHSSRRAISQSENHFRSPTDFVDSKNPAVLKCIRIIEVREMDWDTAHRMEWYSPSRQPLAGFLSFENLEEICFTSLPTGSDKDRNILQKHKLQCTTFEAWVTAWFKERKLRFASGRGPRIYISGWEEVSEEAFRLDDEREEDRKST